MSDTGIHVLSLLGREYRIRASSAEGARLQQAAGLLRQHLAEHQQQHPQAAVHELLLLTALNLCLPLLEQQELLQRSEERLQNCIQQIQQHLLP